MKRLLVIGLTMLLATGLFAGCSKNDNASSKSLSSSDPPSTPNSLSSASNIPFGSTSSLITVVSREDGSGTRGAFIELFGIEQKHENGEAMDFTTEEAIITNSTAVMVTTVAGDPNAIGYISLGSMNQTVRALEIDGVAATVDNIKNGTYKISRPFNIATKADVSEPAQDFINYILSSEGQEIVEANGYVSNGNNGAYKPISVSGKIVVAGSSSVTPVMEKLKEAYISLNPNVTIEIQQNDSTTGMASVVEGICDIGMASREVKESELEQGLNPTVIAMDGIAVIVNNESSFTALSSDQVRDIFTGSVIDWSKIG